MYEWRGSNGGDKRWGMSIKEGSFGGSNEEGEQKRNGVLFWRDHVGRNSSCYWLLHGLAHSFSLSRHYFSLILFHLSLSHDYWSSYDSQAHAVQRSSVHQALSTQFQQKQNYCSFTDKSVYRLNLNTKVPVYKWSWASQSFRMFSDFALCNHARDFNWFLIYVCFSQNPVMGVTHNLMRWVK